VKDTLIVNALSIDLEDWFHPELIRSRVGAARASGAPRPEPRALWAVEPLLGLLDRYDVRATFFVVGEVLRSHPDLIRRIHDAGHEIGCHGWSHRPLWELDPDHFSRELETYDRELAGVMPVEQVVGFRAPTFSVDERTGWAVDILTAHGYRYDSSVFPTRNYLYGVDGCPPVPYRPTVDELTVDHPELRDDPDALIEFPMTVVPYLGINVPVSGGFYLRLMPGGVFRWFLGRVEAEGRPFVIYLHPWEADAATPRLKKLPLIDRFVTYYGAGGVIRKLEALLQRFRFAPIRDVLGIESGRRIEARG